MDMRGDTGNLALSLYSFPNRSQNPSITSKAYN